MKYFLSSLLLVWTYAVPFGQAEVPDWQAGLAKVPLTPTRSVWMAGYAVRSKPSEGVWMELYGKALALEDPSGRKTVLVTLDLLGITAEVAENVTRRAKEKYGLPRDRILLSTSHTHGGPMLERNLEIAYTLTEKQRAAVAAYTREVEEKIVSLIGKSLEKLSPARLSFGHTKAYFAVNRRVEKESGYVIGVNRRGPVDHDVPFLTVDGERGELRAVIFGYACHNTTLGGDIYEFHGDYAGFAQAWLEKRHPEALALFIAGCGADANPYPRREKKWVEEHGKALARAVEGALTGPLKKVGGPLRSRFEKIPLAFATPPTRAELDQQKLSENVYQRRHAEAMLKILDRDGRLPEAYPYPLQVWQFGKDLTLIALAGEVVVDYALRFKKEFGSENTWVVGYSNDVFAYVPSLRVLQEGGYEAEGAMIYYGQPTKFAPSVEDSIVEGIRRMVHQVRVD